MAPATARPQALPLERGLLLFAAFSSLAAAAASSAAAAAFLSAPAAAAPPPPPPPPPFSSPRSPASVRVTATSNTKAALDLSVPPSPTPAHRALAHPFRFSSDSSDPAPSCPTKWLQYSSAFARYLLPSSGGRQKATWRTCPALTAGRTWRKPPEKGGPAASKVGRSGFWIFFIFPGGAAETEAAETEAAAADLTAPNSALAIASSSSSEWPPSTTRLILSAQ